MDDYTAGYTAGWQDCLDDAAVVPCEEATEIEERLLWMLDNVDRLIGVAIVGVGDNGDSYTNFSGPQQRLLGGLALLQNRILNDE